MSTIHDDLDEYEHFEPKLRRQRRGDEESAQRRLERKIREMKCLRKGRIRDRHQARRRMGSERPPNRIG